MLAAAGTQVRGTSAMSSKERVDRALRGQDVDRPPFSLWHHFELEKFGPKRHAQATLEFHKNYSTDLVKVMSDFQYPSPAAPFEFKEVRDPFPEQLKALTIVNAGLGGSAHFVETIFNPWNVAEKRSTPAEVLRMKNEQPQKLLDALEAIAKSEANHARRAIEIGASGVFLAIANAQTGILTPAEYAKFSEPFDRMVLDAVKSAPLNLIHLHGPKVYVAHFLDKPWSSAGINYSAHETGMTIAQVRARYAGLVLAGVNHLDYATRTVEQLRAEVAVAKREAGKKLIVTPGCSVPNDSTPGQLKKMLAAV